ncbi:MobC family plasmid mobilization relaxosome protein [Cereibacter azotoformans]|uniref:Mobilization protein MobC n=1 Tax=Cereibacter azotoformans TaxID=43057 RepID=A0A2T5JT09_9RHOB|nr:plasmid mobilization relaxosome protein MobC [Cereibacter azotoformans]AXQ95756.1 plasmid mobilization relaxosome protein MobC [Cereibacter sphaeroides]PTR12946.1 mobilization protein MobC [Cereibacter azotoformans]UIJ32742.1 MobC family plasmid mobilization relaxosome protein [Cereibacter azotoformans]
MARAGDGKTRSDKRRADRRLSKRVTEEEFLRFEARARAAGYESANAYLSAFVRSDGQDHWIDRKDAARILVALAKIGTNVNQIAHRFNAGRAWALALEDRRIIDDAIKVCEQVMRAIRSHLT